jgi:hypothetical protein
MQFPKSKALRSALIGAAICAAAGLVFVLQAYNAQIHNTMLAPTLRRAAMTPREGYFAGFLFFAFAICCILWGLRDARGEKK